MQKNVLFLFSFVLAIAAQAQQPAQDSSKPAAKIILVPYQSMMYFSDADPDMARFSKLEQHQLRNEIRNQVEANAYHQLLAAFDVVSLMRASALEGEKDLNRIYAATRYSAYSKQQKESYMTNKGREEKGSVKKLLDRFSRKSKDQTFWVSDSSVMLGNITDKEIFAYLNKKYNGTYILFITQFEIATDNKNTIEWTKQEYKREYALHYNLFDKTGTLIRAEVLTIKAGGENNVKDITSKYLIVLAQRLKEILAANEK